MRVTSAALLALSALLAVHAATPKTVDWKDTDGSVQQLTFAGITAAATDAEKSASRAVDKVTYTYLTSQREVEYEIGYHQLTSTGCGSQGTHTLVGGDMDSCNKTAFSDTELPMAAFGVERGADDEPTDPTVVSDRVTFASYIPVIGI